MDKTWISDLYNTQKCIQSHIVDLSANTTDKIYASATAAIVELGEMLQCDTRWKAKVTGSRKEPVYDKEAFKEEFADAFIYLINVLIYAGIDIDEELTAIDKKVLVNLKRFGL